MTITSKSQATIAADSGKTTQAYVVDMFTKTMITGDYKSLDEILDDSFKLSMLRLKSQADLDKRYVIDFYKKNRLDYIKQNCTSDSAIVSSSKVSAIVQLNLRYKSFTHSYFLTLVEKSGGWKIVYAYSLYNLVK